MTPQVVFVGYPTWDSHVSIGGQLRHGASSAGSIRKTLGGTAAIGAVNAARAFPGIDISLVGRLAVGLAEAHPNLRNGLRFGRLVQSVDVARLVATRSVQQSGYFLTPQAASKGSLASEVTSLHGTF